MRLTRVVSVLVITFMAALPAPALRIEAEAGAADNAVATRSSAEKLQITSLGEYNLVDCFRFADLF